MFTNFVQVAQSKGFVFAVDASSTFSSMMQLLQKGLVAAGAFLIIMGLVNLGGAIKDSNGPGRQNAVLEIVGGAMIAAAGAFVTQISI